MKREADLLVSRGGSAARAARRMAMSLAQTLWCLVGLVLALCLARLCLVWLLGDGEAGR